MESQGWLGAVRSGKSFVDVNYIIPQRLRNMKDQNGLNLILGVSRETIERNVLQPMREMYTDRVVGSINGRNIAMVCGCPVYCLGAEKISQVAKIQGMSVKYCYGDEIAKWSPEVFAMLQSRLDKPYSCFDGSCNPEYPGHWLKAFIDREDIDIYVQKYTIFDNPHLPQKFVEDLCKEYEGTVYYGRYIKGEWTLAEGLIYPMFENAIQTPPEGAGDEYCISLDYGTMNAFAALLWAKYGSTWYAVREYYYSGREEGAQKTDEDYAKDLDAWCADIEAPAGGKLPVIIDPSAASFIALLRKRDHRYKVIKADNAVADGIRETANALSNGYIKISPECKKWAWEAGGYVYDDKALDDSPLKVNDHCLTGDTLVMTEDGIKCIKNLVGTSGKVWSYNIDTGKTELKPYHDCRMTQKNIRCIELETKKEKILRCTPDHLLLNVWGEYIEANCSCGCPVVFCDNDKITFDIIKSVKMIGSFDVYNMEVDDNHNFAVNGGLIVHNCMDATRYFVKSNHVIKKALRRNAI